MGVLPAGQADPNAVPAAQAAAAAKVVTKPSALKVAGLQIALAGIKGVSAAIDGIFGVTKEVVPALTGDQLQVGLATVAHIIPQGNIADAVVGALLAGVNTVPGVSHNVEQSMSSAEVSLLAYAQARVDSFVADVENNLDEAEYVASRVQGNVAETQPPNS